MMQRLLHPLILLLGFSSLASCRLVANFLAPPYGCPQFFLNTRYGHVAPTILQADQRYRQICQRYLGVDRFATLYDTVNKIPVYSAYLHVAYRPSATTSPDQWWTEPDLTIAQQAVNRDYFQSGWNRGHLYPVYNNNNAEGVESTYTLTNAAPQAAAFNIQWYNQVEKPVNVYIQRNCRGNRAYIVTGVVPSQNYINNRVRVAGHFWTAFCCLDNNGNVVARGGDLAWWNNGLQLTRYSQIQPLEQQLTNLYNVNHQVQVFGGHC